MNKKFLVTGVTGFVGSQVLKNLISKKIEIRAIVRKGKNIIFKNKDLKVEVIETDDLFKESIEWWSEKCEGIDTVIHIAWYTKHREYLESPKNIDCLIGSLNLAKGAIKAGVKRFVGVGTCFEYDLSLGDLTIKTPLKPMTIYAATKAALYTILLKLLPSESIDFSWCRLFYLFGEGENAQRLFPYIHNKLSKGEIVELTSGRQIRDFLEVSEAGRMIANLAMNNHIGPINICSGIPITIREFAEKIAKEYGRSDLLKFGARPENLFDPPRIVGSKNLDSL